MNISGTLPAQGQPLLRELTAIDQESSRSSLSEVNSQWSDSLRSDSEHKSNHSSPTGTKLSFNEDVVKYSYRHKPSSKLTRLFKNLLGNSNHKIKLESAETVLDLNPPPDFHFRVKKLPLEVRLKNRQKLQSVATPNQSALPKALMSKADDQLNTVLSAWLKFPGITSSLASNQEHHFDLLDQLVNVTQDQDLFSTCSNIKQENSRLIEKLNEGTETLPPATQKSLQAFFNLNKSDLLNAAKSIIEIRSLFQAFLQHANQLFTDSLAATEYLNSTDQLNIIDITNQEPCDQALVQCITSLQPSPEQLLSQKVVNTKRGQHPQPPQSQFRYPIPAALMSPETGLASDIDPMAAVHWLMESLEYTAQSAVRLRDSSAERVGQMLNEILITDAMTILCEPSSDQHENSETLSVLSDAFSIDYLANKLYNTLHQQSNQLMEALDEHEVGV